MRKFLLASVVTMMVACKAAEVTAPVVFTPVVTKVVVTPTAGQIEVGRTTQLSAVVRDQRDSLMPDKTVVWSSSNTAVATVSATGLVTGVAKGSVTILGTVGSVVGSSTVFVIDPTVASVSLTGTVPTPFYVGQTAQLTGTVLDASGKPLTAYAITWASSDATVVSVSSTGLLTALKAGSATVTVSSGGKSASLVVTTTLVPVSSLTLAAEKDAFVGRNAQITPTLKNATGTTLALTQRVFSWASTDVSVATIDANGLLHGVSVGNTKVTCVVENKVGLLDVTVTQVGISYVLVTPDSSNVTVGATKQLTAKAYDADSTALSTVELDGRKFTWASGDVATAVVSTSGLVTAVAEGKTSVTATVSGKSKAAVVKVVTP